MQSCVLINVLFECLSCQLRKVMLCSFCRYLKHLAVIVRMVKKRVSVWMLCVPIGFPTSFYLNHDVFTLAL